MQKNKVSSYSYNVFVGPAPSTGFNFIDRSGNISTGPIIFWPEASINWIRQTNVSLATGLSIGGYDNAYALTTTAGTSGFHGSYLVFPVNQGQSGIFRCELDVYIPSSNPEIKRLYFAKNNGFISYFSELDNWGKIISQGFYGNTFNNGNDNIGFTLLSGTTSTSQFLTTGENTVYFKNYRVLELSGNYHHNLIRKLNRVQSFDYSFDVGRNDIFSLGEQGVTASKPLNFPSLNFNINTVFCGVENDYILGLDCNFPCFFSGFNGHSFKNEHYDISTGINNRIAYSGISNGIKFPFLYTNKKNIYLSVTDSDGKEENGDLHYGSGISIAIGNSYLNYYRLNASLNSLPTVEYGFSAENIEINNEKIGLNPSLTPKNLSRINSGYYILPHSVSDSFPAALNVGDMDITISSPLSTAEDFNHDIGYLQTDWKIQNFTFDINFEREPMTSIGYQLPIDRRLKYPLFANIGIDLIVGANQEQDIENVFKKNYPYTIEATFNHPCLFTGQETYKNVMAKYIFNSADLTSLSSSVSVNNFQRISLGFRQEINPAKNIGLNISGVIFGKNLVETGNSNNSCFNSIKYVHFSGNKTFINSTL